MKDTLKLNDTINIGLLEKYSGKIIHGFLDYLPQIISAIIVLAIGLFLLKYLDKVLTVFFNKTNFDEALEKFAKSFLLTASKVILFVVIISILGIETSSIVAVFGAMAFAIGLALQGSLSNFAGGVLILIFKPFGLGDWITASGKSGSVIDIQIFNTILKSSDGQKIILPNGELSNNVITNSSDTLFRRIDFKIGIGYSDDISLAKKVLERISEDDNKILNNKDVLISVTNLGDSAVEILFRFWTTEKDYWETKCETLEKIKIEFDKAGISFPFPQRNIHIYKEK